MAAIASVMILLILSLIFLAIFCRPRWGVFRTRMKQRLMILVGLYLLLVLLLAYAAWPLLPSGQAQREVAIDSFLSALSEGETQTAMSMIVPAPDEELSVIRAALSTPENRPVSWEVTEPNRRDYAFGTVTFADGQTLDLFIGLEWEWEKARWGVILLEFGREQSTSKARFYLYSTFLPYSWFRGGAIYLSLFCILFTVWQVRRLRQEWANMEAQTTSLPNQVHNF
ncbi:hypothetical protein [Candidatus Leptofilum sp.]|uniref:hypothetical protein n=1 Tax=Candidatus Leptofilum sp. TaxID=3241576 RepID=UPI003B5A3A32